MLTEFKILKTSQNKRNFDYVFLTLSCFLVLSYFFHPFKFLFDPISSIKWLRSGTCLLAEEEVSMDCSFGKPLLINSGDNFKGWFYTKKRIDKENKYSKILVLDKNTKKVIGVANNVNPYLVYVNGLNNEDISIGIHSETLGKTAVTKSNNQNVFIEKSDLLNSVSNWFTVGDSNDLPWDWEVGKNEGNILKIENFDAYVVLVWKK